MARKSTSAEARTVADAAAERVAELEAKASEVAEEYQATRLRLLSASAAEIEALSTRRGELERLHADLANALQSARDDRESAARAFAVARVGEAVRERDEFTAALEELLRPIVVKARATARKVAEREGEIRGLDLPVNVGKPIDASAQTEESALLAAWARVVVGGDGATVEVRFVRDTHYQNPPAGIGKRQYTAGTVIPVPIGTAFVLEGEGVAVRVEAA